MKEFSVEDVRPMFNADTFAWVKNVLGIKDLKELQAVEYAIVHRYTTEELGYGGADDDKSERLVRNLVACLRLIRPMRQRASLMGGELREGGKINVQHFEHPKGILGFRKCRNCFTFA